MPAFKLWNGTEWEIVGPVGTEIPETEPTSPEDGALWLDPNDDGPEASTPAILPGTGLAWAESGEQYTHAAASTVYDLLTITFDVPADRPVYVHGKAPSSGGAATSQTYIYLTDAANAIIDASGYRATTANYFGHTGVDELIPAGSGTVTRKLRTTSTLSGGFLNLFGSGLITLGAVVR